MKKFNVLFQRDITINIEVETEREEDVQELATNKLNEMTQKQIEDSQQVGHFDCCYCEEVEE